MAMMMMGDSKIRNRSKFPLGFCPEAAIGERRGYGADTANDGGHTRQV